MARCDGTEERRGLVILRPNGMAQETNEPHKAQWKQDECAVNEQRGILTRRGLACSGCRGDGGGGAGGVEKCGLKGILEGRGGEGLLKGG